MLLRWINWILSYRALCTHLGDVVPSEKQMRSVVLIRDFLAADTTNY